MMEAGEHLSCLPDQKRTGGHTLGANNSSTSTTMPKSRVWTSSPGPMAEASLSMGCPRPRGVFTSEILLIFGKRGFGSGGKTAVFTDHVLPRPRKLHPGLPVCRKTPQGRNSSSGGLQATLSARLSILTWGALPIFPAIQTALDVWSTLPCRATNRLQGANSPEVVSRRRFHFTWLPVCFGGLTQRCHEKCLC